MIGGGVAGASCAYHLARAGTPVQLLERTALAAGSSGRSAAFIETQYTEPDRIRMCAYGLQLYRQLANDFPLNYQTRGKLLIGRRPHDRATFEASLRLQRELGLDDSTILEHKELVGRFPHLKISNDEFALYGPTDGYLDPVALCHAYAAAAAAQGATIRPSTEVLAVRRSNDHYTVETDRENLVAEALVIATGPWTRPLRGLLELPIHGYRRQVALLAASDITETPLVVDNNNAGCLYFRDDGPGRLIAGLHTEERNNDVIADPDDYTRTVDPQFAQRVAELVAARLRDAAPPHPIGGWAGLYPISADGRFALGESKRNPRLFLCAGLAGNGVQLSAAAGAIITQLIHDEPQTIVPDLATYDPDRFANTEPRAA